MAVALVTGGTSGIGAAFSRSLAAQGYDLVLVARSVPRLEEMADEIRALGRSVEIFPADLADRADVARVAERLEDPSRPIDMLVNNAGFGVHTSLIDSDVSAHDRAFEVMCRAVLVLSGAAARGMLPRGTGKIVNVSSTAGFVTMGAYSALKAWVTSFTEGLAVELRGTGIGVTALCPGWVHTEFHERAGIKASSIPNFLWLDAEQLVTACLRDVDRGRVISIPTVRYRTLIWLARHAPRSAIRAVSGSISSSRKKPVT
ncbi:short-chain dehydrogenase [Agreia sp. Leaf335]|uniref:SDR family NAD(P)-dependent oxidoreductase n=1 Tax=Agreia sp. Leaf335 TaxID=1736340 RepID=UPI0006FB5C75|nr:SDR family oxidoreductase [Agreia sp. Leaf335]KQR20437.1 short-chain dehydrogenase [Agreia sp. Leaf335]